MIKNIQKCTITLIIGSEDTHCLLLDFYVCLSFFTMTHLGACWQLASQELWVTLCQGGQSCGF